MILSFKNTKKLLLKYRIPFPPTKEISFLNEAKNFAKKFGFPLVLKIFSPKVLHRTEKGGIRLDLKNLKELKKAFKELEKFKSPLLIQKQIKGIELSLGMKRDKIFGPVVMFGAGGIFIELIKDISFGICPLSQKEALEMIRETKISKILKGYRNFPKINLGKIAKLISSLCRLSLKEKEIKEIDFNPLICENDKIFACDFKFII